MRLIDADALMEEFELAQKSARQHGRDYANAFYNNQEICTEWWCVEEMVDNQPTVEAAPVVHGRWVKQNPLVDTEECSHCGYNIVSTELETPFCPWCGAAMKMDGGEE